MTRRLTVLIALLAQGTALMSPVCLIRCFGVDGHQCVELATAGCHCHDDELDESLTQDCTVATCCNHRHEHDEHDAPAGWQFRSDDCSCRHSMVESAPQTLSKSLDSAVLSPWQQLPLARTTWSLSVLSTGNEARFPVRWRPQESPQLAVLATVMLRA